MPRLAAFLKARTTVPVLLLAIVCSISAPAAPPTPPAHQLPYPAPNFSRPDLTGKTIRLAEYKGKVVLLNFWATWCGPCLVEMPKFADWQNQYRAQGLQVLGVSMDDSEAPVRKTVSKLRLDYPILMGDEKIGTAYGGVLGLPVTLLIDRTGVVRARFEGGADLAAIQKELTQLLK